MVAQIRGMTAADYHEVYGLWTSTPGMGLNDMDDSEAGITAYLRRDPRTCFVAALAGRVVGAILAGHDGRRGYVYHTAVAVDVRAHGIGSALLQAALDALAAEGIRKVAMVVFARNQTGNGFWEKLGFTVRDDLVYRNKALGELRRIDT